MIYLNEMLMTLRRLVVSSDTSTWETFSKLLTSNKSQINYIAKWWKFNLNYFCRHWQLLRSNRESFEKRRPKLWKPKAAAHFICLVSWVECPVTGKFVQFV